MFSTPKRRVRDTTLPTDGARQLGEVCCFLERITMIELSPGERRALRASAHHLSPVVSIAGNGLTPAVIAEIERNLQAHELIKIKVHGVERAERDLLMLEVCNTVNAAAVQHIGTILVIWRKRSEDAATAAAPKAPVRQPAKEKSARAFVAQARRSALIQAAAAKKRGPAGRTRSGGGGGFAKPSSRGR